MFVCLCVCVCVCVYVYVCVYVCVFVWCVWVCECLLILNFVIRMDMFLTTLWPSFLAVDRLYHRTLDLCPSSEWSTRGNWLVHRPGHKREGFKLKLILRGHSDNRGGYCKMSPNGGGRWFKISQKSVTYNLSNAQLYC